MASYSAPTKFHSVFNNSDYSPNALSSMSGNINFTGVDQFSGNDTFTKNLTINGVTTCNGGLNVTGGTVNFPNASIPMAAMMGGNTFVDLTTNQTIAGNKTYNGATTCNGGLNVTTGPVSFPNASISMAAMMGGSAYVDLTTNQTIAGNKTYTGGLLLSTALTTSYTSLPSYTINQVGYTMIGTMLPNQTISVTTAINCSTLGLTLPIGVWNVKFQCTTQCPAIATTYTSEIICIQNTTTFTSSSYPYPCQYVTNISLNSNNLRTQEVSSIFNLTASTTLYPVIQIQTTGGSYNLFSSGCFFIATRIA